MEYQQNQQYTGVAMGWDDEVEAKQYILLPEGEYEFKIKQFQREQFNGSEKMPPCNVANITFEIFYQGERVFIDKKLFLVDTYKGQLFDFFKSIGSQATADGRIRMNWQMVPGATGRCIVNHREYKGNKYNQIKAFVDPTKNNPAQPQQQSWQGGKF